MIAAILTNIAGKQIQQILIHADKSGGCSGER
jgi:hypothetical protein